MFRASKRSRKQSSSSDPELVGNNATGLTGFPAPPVLARHYGMRENPFGSSPDPRYLYDSLTHREAFSSLLTGIDCGVGFQALIAQPGMGKTTVLFRFLQKFHAIANTALIFQVQADPQQFLRGLLIELGSQVNQDDIGTMQAQFNKLLLEQRRAGKRTIIIVDEAQNLSPEVLESLRILSNFEYSSSKLLQVVLAGQPELGNKLCRPELTQLQQRISIISRLLPLGPSEINQYIKHRLMIAGYCGPDLFTAKALAMISDCGGGIPRNINTLCLNALLLGAAVKERTIDVSIVSEVIADLDLSQVGTPMVGVKSDTDVLNELESQMPAATRTETSLIDPFLQLMAERAGLITGASGAAIAMLDGSRLICRGRSGGSAPLIGSIVDTEKGLTGLCVRSQETQQCIDAENDSIVDKEVCRHLDITSIVSVPIVSNMVLKGVLQVFSAQTNAFNSLHVSKLTMLVQQIVLRDSLESTGYTSLSGNHAQPTITHHDGVDATTDTLSRAAS